LGGGRWGEFQGEGSVLGVLHVPKRLVVGQSNGSFRNEKKKSKLNCKCTQVPSERAGYVKLNPKL